MKKLQFDITNRTWGNDEVCDIEAPNLNVAIMQLAMEHDLSDANAIYIERKDGDDD